MADTSSPAETSQIPESQTTPETLPDVPASSSEAQKGETKETLLEAVLKAVQPKDDEDTPSEHPPSSEDKAQGSDAGQAGEKTDLSKDPTPEELAAYKKGTRERILQLIDQRNSFRAEADVTRVLR